MYICIVHIYVHIYTRIYTHIYIYIYKYIFIFGTYMCRYVNAHKFRGQNSLDRQECKSTVVPLGVLISYADKV